MVISQFFRRSRRADANASSVTESSPPPRLRRQLTASIKSSLSLTQSAVRSSKISGEVAKAVISPPGLSLLYSPTNAHVDLIFVHGLGSDSKTTWSKPSQESSFWPQDWLPHDPTFEGVRIHTFHYSSDYVKSQEDFLNIHQIGKWLLDAMSTSPHLTNSQTRIMIAGHSMGGLVIKKAVTLARRDDTRSALASRIKAIYFLATPHRGVDSPRMLKNLLKATACERVSTGDLDQASGTIQAINDEFQHVSQNIELWSFYETQHLKRFSSLIVEPEAAILGFGEEKQMPMSADHHSICKFDSTSDPNYTTVRNALASTVRQLTNETAEPDLRDTRARITGIMKYLGVPSDGFEEDLTSLRDTRVDKTCRWLTSKDAYIECLDGEAKDGKILWIKGKPASGKSVLVGYAIDQLHKLGENCSYFFFKHGDRTKSGISICLRTLAFQMARSSVPIQDAILAMRKEGIQLERLDVRTLWMILFTNGIFRTRVPEEYVWVIDAVDESNSPSAFINLILSKIDSEVPLRVLFTSRDTTELDQGMSSLAPEMHSTISISTMDTLADIKLVIQERLKPLTFLQSDVRRLLAEKMALKTDGSFLWTDLVLKRTLKCQNKERVDRVFGEMPSGLEPLYKRTLEHTPNIIAEKELCKAILIWASCAIRPITIGELKNALEIELGDKVPHLDETIDALCGQLLVKDYTGEIQMIHETAREFLLAPDTESEFHIDSQAAHTRIAQACLKYLVSDEMKPPTTGHREYPETTSKDKAAFACYASTACSYHLSMADPKSPELFQLVLQFLESNVLSWIETIAARRDIYQLIEVSKHLELYVEACALEYPPLDLRIQTLSQWVLDLIRIATKFGNALMLSPFAVYSLIPPFCPSESMVHNASSETEKLTVLGTSRLQWDDMLASIDLGPSQASAICYGDKFLAVGLLTGAVTLYDTISYQEHAVLDHEESVKFIKFRGNTGQVVTCGMKSTKVWDIKTGQVLHRLSSPPRVIEVAFDGNSLLAVSQDNFVKCWVLQNVIVESESHWKFSPGDNDVPTPDPAVVAISASHKLLAAAYVGKPVAVWSLEGNTHVGNCGKTPSTGTTGAEVVAMAFNPNPGIRSLAISYLDGDLVLVDPLEDKQLRRSRASGHTLASSPDGRLLAAATTNGVTQIYQFQTLGLLYSVKSPGCNIQKLSFSKDGFRFADIRGSKCTVWEPTVLPQDSLSDHSSGTTPPPASHATAVDEKTRITAVTLHKKAPVIFCGRDDGAVLLYCAESAKCLKELYTHQAPVHLLRWCQQREAIMSFDSAGKIFCHKIQESPIDGWPVDPEVIFHSQLVSGMATDVLIGDMEDKFLVSTERTDYMFTFDGKQREERGYEENEPARRQWIRHPTSSQQMICFETDNISVYNWADWTKKWCFDSPLIDDMMQMKSLNPYSLQGKSKMLLELSEQNSSSRTTDILLFDTSSFGVWLGDTGSDVDETDNLTRMISFSSFNEKKKDEEEDLENPGPAAVSLLHTQTRELARIISHLIGIRDTGELVFLDRSSWICSINLEASGINLPPGVDYETIEYHRHCFIPYDWFAGRRDIVCTISQTDLIFARDGDLAIIRGCLDYREKAFLY